MSKLLLIIWLLESAALAWLFGYTLLYGNTPDRTTLAGDLDKTWGGVGAVCVWMLWKERKQKEQKPG